MSRDAPDDTILIEIQYRMLITGVERLVTYSLEIGERAGAPFVQREILRYKRGRYLPHRKDQVMQDFLERVLCVPPALLEAGIEEIENRPAMGNIARELRLANVIDLGYEIVHSRLVLIERPLSTSATIS